MPDDQPARLGLDLICFPDLDGTHLGIATGLLRADVDADTAVRALVTEVATANEVFTSCLELLLAEASLVAHATPGGESDRKSDGGAAFLLDLAKDHPRTDVGLFLRQIGMTLLRDTGTHRVCVTPVSAFDLADLCLVAARRIEAMLDISVETQISRYRNAVLRRQQAGFAGQ